jgi:multidrug/hemolysin transport system permease protein
MMEEPMSEAFAGAPVQVITQFKQTMGIVFFFGDKELSPFINMLVLAATAVVFLFLTVISISAKKRQ